MAASVSERAAELAPLYNAILYAFDDGEDWDPERIQQIQAVGYKLRQMLEEHDMAYWTRVPQARQGSTQKTATGRCYAQSPSGSFSATSCR